MNAAVKAEKLDDCRLAVLVGEGIDPTEKKYDHLLNDLLGIPFSGALPEAREVVSQALVRFQAARERIAAERRRARVSAEKNNSSRMRGMLKDRLRHVPLGKRVEAGIAILREFANAFETEFPGSRVECLQEKGEGESCLHQNHRYTEHAYNASQDNETLRVRSAPTFNAVSVAI